VRETLITRAEALCASQDNDYGKIIPEWYGQRVSDTTDAFKAHDEFVVPWDCDTIP
jgi:hypothetical protein